MAVAVWLLRRRVETVSTSSRLQLPGNLSFTKQLQKLSGCVYFSIHYFNAVAPSAPSVAAEHYECVAGIVFVYLTAVKCSASVAHNSNAQEKVGRRFAAIWFSFVILSNRQNERSLTKFAGANGKFK